LFSHAKITHRAPGRFAGLGREASSSKWAATPDPRDHDHQSPSDGRLWNQGEQNPHGTLSRTLPPAFLILTLQQGLSEAVASKRTEEGDGAAGGGGALQSARPPMGGRAVVERLHGGALPTSVLTDRGLAMVHSTTSSRCGGLEDAGGGSLLLARRRRPTAHLLPTQGGGDHAGPERVDGTSAPTR
jgi:hypothetical protein